MNSSGSLLLDACMYAPIKKKEKNRDIAYVRDGLHHARPAILESGYRHTPAVREALQEVKHVLRVIDVVVWLCGVES
jgi:hypothetical protein